MQCVQNEYSFQGNLYTGGKSKDLFMFPVEYQGEWGMGVCIISFILIINENKGE